MRAVISQYDKGRLTQDQLDLATDVLRALYKKRNTAPGADQTYSGYTSGRKYELVKKMDSFGGFHYQVLTVDGVDFERSFNTSTSRYVCQLIHKGKLVRYKVPNAAPAALPTPQTPSPSKLAPKVPPKKVEYPGIVIGKDTVSVHGVELQRFEKPGPLTPERDMITIPKGVDRELKIVALGLANCYPVLLFGDTGTGKTTMVEYLAYLCNVNLVKVIGDPEYGPSLWIGHLHARAGETYWADGDLPTAMKGIEGDGKTWLFVDELSRMMADNTSPLLPVLEVRGGKHGKLRLADNPDPKTKMVDAHPDFRVVMAMNPFDADFAGTNEVDKALLRRARVPVELHYPNEEAQANILAGKFPGVAKPIIQRVARVATALRQDRRQKLIGFPCSPDELETWLSLTPELGFQLAAEVALVNKANEEDKPRIRERIERG